jgi:UDP-N-acetylglucosamine acyltransferase
LKIHPSAIVASQAQLGVDVEVGPGSIIGPEVSVGANTTIQAHVILEGNITIGRGNFIGHGAVIGSPPQDLSFSGERKTRVEIGDENVIREYCTIHRGSAEGSATRIGNKNFLMVGVHVGHNCEIASNVIIANNCLLAGHVRVDDQAFLGGGSTFHQNMRVGRLVMVQGSSAFGRDLPPFTLAAERNSIFGLNLVGLRRAGFNREQRDEIKGAFKLLYLSGLNVSQAVEKARSLDFGELGREFFEFVVNARRQSICPYRGKKDREEAAAEI